MTFLEHGDIRKSGRAILIACTIFVLLNECSEAFPKVVLFGFDVRITHEMLVGFLRVGIWALCAVFAVRFVQGYADWVEVFSGKKAVEKRTSALNGSDFGDKFLISDTRGEAINKADEVIDRIYGGKDTRGLKKRIRSEYLQYYAKYLGDWIDTLLLQVILPISAVVYAFWLSPALTLVCKAVP